MIFITPLRCFFIISFSFWFCWCLLLIFFGFQPMAFLYASAFFRHAMPMPPLRCFHFSLSDVLLLILRFRYFISLRCRCLFYFVIAMFIMHSNCSYIIHVFRHIFVFTLFLFLFASIRHYWYYYFSSRHYASLLIDAFRLLSSLLLIVIAAFASLFLSITPYFLSTLLFRHAHSFLSSPLMLLSSMLRYAITPQRLCCWLMLIDYYSRLATLLRHFSFRFLLMLRLMLFLFCRHTLFIALPFFAIITLYAPLFSPCYIRRWRCSFFFRHQLIFGFRHFISFFDFWCHAIFAGITVRFILFAAYGCWLFRCHAAMPPFIFVCAAILIVSLPPPSLFSDWCSMPPAFFWCPLAAIIIDAADAFRYDASSRWCWFSLIFRFFFASAGHDAAGWCHCFLRFIDFADVSFFISDAITPPGYAFSWCHWYYALLMPDAITPLLLLWCHYDDADCCWGLPLPLMLAPFSFMPLPCITLAAIMLLMPLLLNIFWCWYHYADAAAAFCH